MGQLIDKTEFSAEEHEQFRSRLATNLLSLHRLLDRPGFGEGPRSLGAELELYLIDAQGRPLPKNLEILEQAKDKRLTSELNRYNLEANLTPRLFDDSPFTALEQEMHDVLASLNELLNDSGGHVLPIGILPTLVREDFSREMLTPEDRFIAMMRDIRKRRKESIAIDLQGEESVSFTTDLVTCEGANTSLQIHYRAEPSRFTDLFNAFQLTTPVMVGLSANSPFFLGRSVWHETRIDLFRQAIDARDERRRELQMPERVYLGHGWVRHGPYELFAEKVSLYRTVLPVCDDEDTESVLESGGTPRLFELDMHAGTIWPWNRAVYDHCDQGHVRIELRSMPAGPTASDMVANAAFAIGLAEGLAGDMESLIPAIPFQIVSDNLERAARHGLEASLLWPSDKRRELEERSLHDVATSLLPLARLGLTSIDVSKAEIDRYLGIVEHRLAKQQTGASWQLAQFNYFAESMPHKQALHEMLARYRQHHDNRLAVADWPLEHI